MTGYAVAWHAVRVEGDYTVVQVAWEPGRIMEIPVRTTLLNKPDGDAMILAAVERVRETQVQLREGP